MSEIEILFEDNHLIAVNKPKGLLTQPSGTTEDSLEAQVKAFIKQRDEKLGNVFLEAVHRLDRPVSGIVLFAKTSKALSRMNAAQRSRVLEKTYVATVKGTFPHRSGTLEHHLLHADRRADVVDEGHPGGKLAKLEYRVTETSSGNSTVEVRLLTGRYHQIRAQLAAVRCPIHGDARYGSSVSRKEGIALHHSHLVFPHPVGGQRVEVLCAPAG